MRAANRCSRISKLLVVVCFCKAPWPCSGAPAKALSTHSLQPANSSSLYTNLLQPLSKPPARRIRSVLFSVVQWHPFSPFLVAAPLKTVFPPKKGSLFFQGHRTTESWFPWDKATRRRSVFLSNAHSDSPSPQLARLHPPARKMLFAHMSL